LLKVSVFTNNPTLLHRGNHNIVITVKMQPVDLHCCISYEECLRFNKLK